MHVKINKGYTLRAIFLLAFLIFLPFLIEIAYAASMDDYCNVPPYVKKDVKPNIMIIMDNALGMGDWAYWADIDCSYYGTTTNNYCPSKTYAGYFKSGLMYKYDSPRWEPSTTAPTPPDPYISGNILNWATTSKYDLLQSILVGGISTSRQTNVNTLVSKSNAWDATLTYTDEHSQSRTCIFKVDDANVEIKDSTGGSCGYLDTPHAHPIPGDPMVSFIEPDTKLVMHTPQDKKQKLLETNIENIKDNETGGGHGLLSKIWSNIINFLIPDAEAAKPLAISPGNPPDGTECTAYAYTISAAGGDSTGTGYTWNWSVKAPSTVLPPGLTLTKVGTPGSGYISGTPTTAGTYNFTVLVTDNVGATDTKDYSITISATTLTITTPSPLSDAMETVPYSTTISTNNVCTTGGYEWSISAGSLPSGLSLNASTGVISGMPSGTPASAGPYCFTVRVVGYGNHIATKTFGSLATCSTTPGLTVLPAPIVLTITTTSPLPDATKDSAYTTTITAINYSGACAWSISAGSLPPGLTLDAAGTPSTSLHGTPTATGTYNFTIQVNSPGASGTPTTKTFDLTVLAVPVRTTGNLNVKVCVGDYTYNCSNVSTLSYPWPANSGCSEINHTKCILKSGIVDEFWSQARFGVQDFNKQAGNGVPNISNCIESCTSLQTTDPNYCPTPKESFLTAIENAVPIDVITPMVDAEWETINYYATDNTSNCSPFRDTTQTCMKNFVLTITAGVGANQNNVTTKIYNASNGYTVPSECSDTDYVNLTKNACFGYNTDLRSTTFGATNLSGKQYVSTYIVNTMGTAKVSTYNPETAPSNTGDMLYQAATKGGGNYYEVTDPTQLRDTLMQAFQDIIKRAAAGTAASVLASGEGSGANLVQAVFYPRRKFYKSAAGDYDEIAWIGRLTNLWYYIDPYFTNSNIREDGGDVGATTVVGDYILDLDSDNNNDFIVQLYFDTTAEATKARRWADTNGDGVVDGAQLSPDIEFEKLGSLWEAGLELWKRTVNPSNPADANNRTIYTTTGSGLINFSITNRTTLQPYLQAADDDVAEAIIRYVHGEDNPTVSGTTYSYRSRSVKVDLDNDNDTTDAGEGYKVWKLGDVLNSTPKISSWLQLNTYDSVYSDGTYKDFLDTSGAGPDYKNRGMVFAGANDGMLHAFNLGKLELTWSGQTSTQKSRLTGSNFGKEMWAFIPKNALPYLTYQKETGYGNCHIYTVDLTPYVFDASICASGACAGDYWDQTKNVNSWRTILIGGMRFGGACRITGDSCTDCVKTPITDPADGTKGLGYSSYFALDVTEQNSPTLLWEFSNPELGFATTGPAVVRINALTGGNPDTSKNGKWFVVFGSGPTGPIDTDPTRQQFLGRSDQNLKLFVLDLKTGTLQSGYPKDTGISNAFAGSMLSATHDTDGDYQDDLMYIPYVKKCTATDGICTVDTWTNGGIGRLVTKEDLTPDNWVWSKLIDDIGPVTSSVVRLQSKSKGQLWVYAGSGRYYFEQGATTDDATGQRQLFGIKDPCYSISGFDSACTTTRSFCNAPTTSNPCGDLSNVTNIADVPADPDAAGFYGWYVNLDPPANPNNPDNITNCNGVGFTACTGGKYGYCEGNPVAIVCRDYRAEREITDPLSTTSGVVFFTTYKPFADECTLGGKSFIWAVKYNTGGAAGTLLKGKALVQVSTGSIEQIDLSTAFTAAGGRKSAAMEGVPPTAQGLSLISTPPPVKRVLHIRER